MIDLGALAQQLPTPWVERPQRRRTQGRLDELAGWLAAAQGTWPPAEPTTARLLAITPPLTTAPPPATAPPSSDAPLAGGAGVDGVGVGVAPGWGMTAAGLEGILEAARVVGVTASPLVASGDVEEALALGIAAADAAADEGVDLLIVMGAADTVPALTGIAALAHLEPVDAVATGVDDEVWYREVVAVRDLLRRVRPHADTPYALLSTLDSPVLSALAGLILQAANRRTPVILDGLDACVAAASLYQIAPFATEWWAVADSAETPGQRAAVDLIRLKPIFGLGTATGYAGPLAAPLLRAAARLAAHPA
jgi:nicotinate-nucleotide--dimethylbenzimidazole phosphoribosyltransferase